MPGSLLSTGGNAERSCPQPRPGVTPQSLVSDENGAEMPGVLPPPPAARAAPSITTAAGLHWDADPVLRTPGGLRFSWEGLGCSGPALAPPAQLKGGSARPHHRLCRDSARNATAKRLRISQRSRASFFHFFPACVGPIQPRSLWEGLGMSAWKGTVPGRAPAAQVKDSALPQCWSPPVVHSVPCLSRRYVGSTGSPLSGQRTCPGHCK